MIGLSTLYQLGYRVTHAKNISLATNTLRRIKQGAITHDDIDRAIAALEHSPLSQATVLHIAKDANGGTR